MNDAEIYNQYRRILLGCIHKHGKAETFTYLDKYKKDQKISQKSYIGLKAELNFYADNLVEYKLTAALDVGDKVDFVGELNGKYVRIDVSTNLMFKTDIEPIEKFLNDGFDYQIAHLDATTGKLKKFVDVVDLAFPSCTSCKGGHLFPVVVLLDQNRNQHGDATGTYDQIFIDVCEGCHEYTERDRITTHFLPTLDHYMREAQENGIKGPELEDGIENFTSGCLRYLTANFEYPMVALGQHIYVDTGPKGEGDWQIQLIYTKPYLKNRLPPAIDAPHDL